MNRLCLLLIALLSLSAPALAQTPTVTVGQPAVVEWAHDGANATGFRLYLDNLLVAELPVPAPVSGPIRYTLPATVIATRGAHTLEVSAFNPDRESPRTALPFTAVSPAPLPPTNFHFVVTVALNPDGTVSLRWVPAPAQ